MLKTKSEYPLQCHALKYFSKSLQFLKLWTSIGKLIDILIS